MLKYKGMSVEEVLELGNVALVDGMKNSMQSKKSREKKNAEVVAECVEIIEKLDAWKKDNGFVKNKGKRGKWDGVEIAGLSDGDLADMYEDMYSRRWYHGKVGNRKELAEIEQVLDEIKMEKKRRFKEKLMEELQEK